MAQRYEIRPDWIARMRQLEGFKIVVIADDSGSMASIVAASSATAANPYAPQRSRWDELKEGMNVIVDLATCLDPEGVDIYFLNRPPVSKVTQHAQVEHLFHQPPGGFTPLSRTLRAVFGNTQQALAEGKKLLIIIATDGQPTDDSGNVQINEFFSLLANKPRGVFVQIMACTDDEGAVQYLNAADENIPLLDVSDDFHSERREILRAQGAGFHFTYGDYIAKCMLGPIDPCACKRCSCPPFSPLPLHKHAFSPHRARAPLPQTLTTWTLFSAGATAAAAAAAPLCSQSFR
jgi:hypothetical protein